VERYIKGEREESVRGETREIGVRETEKGRELKGKEREG